MYILNNATYIVIANKGLFACNSLQKLKSKCSTVGWSNSLQGIPYDIKRK